MELNKGQLSRIEIKGFKSLKNCSVDFSKINVLIGSNGAGKSNFISAFELLDSVVNKNLQPYVMQSGVNTLLYNGRSVTGRISFDVNFEESGYGFDLMPTNDYSVYVGEERFFYKDQPWKLWTLSTMKREADWDRANDLSDTEVDEEIRKILRQTDWRVYHFHDTDQSARLKQTTYTSNNVFLQKDAGNLAAILYLLKQSYQKNYREIVDTIRLAAPFFDDFVLVPQPPNQELITLRWKQRGCDDVFLASQLSDGTLRFICLAVLFLQPKALQPETIIIDEPELGLHPFAITLLSEMIESVGVEKQVVLTTQSAELLNEFDPEDVIVVDRDQGETVFKRLDASSLEAWLEEYTLGELWKKNLLGGRPSL